MKRCSMYMLSLNKIKGHSLQLYKGLYKGGQISLTVDWLRNYMAHFTMEHYKTRVMMKRGSV